MNTTSINHNTLADATSPYLLQHADNPVHWHPWTEQILATARTENKPILLSIGYSACHWCHVMAHESFEDQAVATLMNQHFVNIKVDREERPDLDKIYQTAHHLLTQRAGGWPLTMFLSPHDLTPFFGGTYFPPQARFGLPSFRDVLRQIANAYHAQSGAIEQQNQRLRDALQSLQAGSSCAVESLDTTALDTARTEAAEAFDAKTGGFGGAPKFPHPSSIDRLLRHHAATARRGKADMHALHMARFSLQCMARGGIFDHLGGGFCRYATDAHWMIPHFEKMLYDNGPLLGVYSNAYKLTGDELFKTTALETADWVLSEMQSEQGGFYSSVDADSEGIEGKYYVWEREEVKQLLNDPQYAVFARLYGLDQQPNFEGRWHLYRRGDIPAIAQELGIPETSVVLLITEAQQRLLQHRRKRILPARDDKILTSWNALMIKGLAEAGLVFERPGYVAAAYKALQFVRETLWRRGRLLATCKDGRAHLNAYLDDYAFLIDAILTLLQAQWHNGSLEFAVCLADTLLDNFADTANGGFYFTARDHESLLQRSKSFQDDALPAGNGIAAFGLNRLGHLLGKNRYIAAAERTLCAGWRAVEQYPWAYPAMLLALEEYLSPPRIIVLRGTAAELAIWGAAARENYAPAQMVYAIDAACRELPGLLNLRTSGDTAIAYVCRGQTCDKPLTALADFRTHIR